MRKRRKLFAVRRRRLTAALACAVACGSVAATAAAQDLSTDPHATVEQQAAQNDLDNDVVPVAKESDLWLLAHGAEFGETQTVDASATSFDTDLFAVGFANRTVGLAGGSACPEPIERQEGEDAAAFGERVARCERSSGKDAERVPAIYRYRQPGDRDPVWERLEVPGGEEPGYVGAITWIDSDRALIVGGSGTYPRRDLGWGQEDQFGRSNAIRDPTDPDKADPAGEARAWLYERGSDRLAKIELSALTQDRPDRAGMRGLTAADCYEDPTPTPGEQRVELCFAGGLGQIWEWRDGEFSGHMVDASSPDADLVDSQLFRYRVRDIEFLVSDVPKAAAVTAGCCAELAVHNAPYLLTYGPPSSGQPPRWDAHLYNDRVGFDGVEKSNNELNDKPELPDSYYSLTVSPSDYAEGFREDGMSAVVSPGGPEQALEQPSAITGTSSTRRGQSVDADWLRPSAGTTRLVAGDGDSRFHTRAEGTLTPKRGGDGEPDWAVGELRSTRREGLGAQGVVVATALPPSVTEVHNAGVQISGTLPGSEVTVRPSADEVVGGWKPIDEEKFDAYRRSSHFLLPSYSANAVDIVGDEDDGWAVGDHGAILRLNTGARNAVADAAEPPPPRLGGGRVERVSDAQSYDSARPPTPHSAGAVRPLTDGAGLDLERPRMEPYGTVDGWVDEIVMSRDGSEGWAIGWQSTPNGQVPALHRYTAGGGWSYCDPLGIEGLVPPDPACEAIAPLHGYVDSTGSLRTAKIVSAARIPLENDSNPANDDELEIVALGQGYTGPETGGNHQPALLRYRDGRWSFEKPRVGAALAAADVTRLLGMAFSAPDHGWLASPQGTSIRPQFFRFDGERWIDCSAEPQRCGDTNRQPTEYREIKGLTAAGERVYLYGARMVASGGLASQADTARSVPMIIYREPGGGWTDGSGPGEVGGGFDPGFGNPATEHSGVVDSLSVVRSSDGYEGWAVGAFASGARLQATEKYVSGPAEAALMRMEPAAGWRPFRSPGVFEEQMLYRLADRPEPASSRLQVTYPDAGERGGPYIGQTTQFPTQLTGGHLFGFDHRRQRFELLHSGRPQGTDRVQVSGEAHPEGATAAMAPDGSGGFWAAVNPLRSNLGYVFRWTDEPPRPVFEDTANPAGVRGMRLTALSGAPDGSVWAATNSNQLYRHDRQLGWQKVEIPGWDSGRVVTRPSSINAVAVGPDGEGFAVGEGGRVAAISADRVALDPAAGTSCALGAPPPCGTSRDLTAVDVAPDGAAMAGGKRLSLIWRAAGGGFRTIEKPATSSSATIEGVSYPTPTRAYVATDSGRVFRGERSGGSWTWSLENVDAKGELTSVDEHGDPLAIRAIDVDASGHGYAVGERGLVLQRTSEGLWHRVVSPVPEELTAVELSADGDHVLIGGMTGVILTGSAGRLELARPGDFAGNRERTGRAVLGIAYLPGSTEGSVDAWAAVAPSVGGRGDDRLLRHRSQPDDPSLAGAPLEPLPDAPSDDPGELSIAAFGKADCDFPDYLLCPQMSGTTTTNELAGRRIVDALAGRDEVDLAVLSGDLTDSATLHGSSLGGESIPSGPALAGQTKQRRYGELVLDELEEAGVPVLSAVGGQDLSETVACGTDRCHTSKALVPAGENLAWREAFAGRMEPWGSGEDELDPDAVAEGSSGEAAPGEGEYEFVAVRGADDGSVRTEDQRADADGEGAAPEAKAEIGGANTHYAVEAIRDGERVARIVFVDTSMRSLQASDPLQQPQEPLGGQARFLERMICKQGGTTSTGDECTRAKDQAAIVVSNTPTYSYGPGALTHTATDAATFEALMLRHDVDLVISGALGYNGLYYTLAPGIHEPCPGGEHPEGPPKGGPSCGVGSSNAAMPGGELQKLLEEQGLSGAVPTLIASGAGGKFGPDGQQQADGPAGQWHGYSLARLQPGGEVVIEQRPILDWIGIDARAHSLHAKARLPLTGYGRSPISTTTEGQIHRAFHYEIENAAITHRYDLLLADPDRPWVPCEADEADCEALHAKLSVKPGEPVPTSQLASAEEPANASATGADSSSPSDSASQPHNPCSPYLCLPKRIATVDRLSGEVKAGDGKYPETFAVAVLSVDDKVATYPLDFKPSPSFVVTPFEGPPQLPANAQPAAPPPPSLPKPQIPSLTLPTPPSLPAIPPLVAATPPEPAPPAPPAPPPPAEQPSPLNLSVAPTGLTVATPTAVIQPPTPPVNPAPPGGARREARQRQAAAQKSGADSAEEGSDIQELGGDHAAGRDSPDQPMVRHEQAATRMPPVRPVNSFSPLEPREQPSAWARGALYGGGITLMAFALAAGWSRGRPTPRRPVPAFERARGGR